jgi:YebC/PmpR family DNA-binding regulatory protein
MSGHSKWATTKHKKAIKDSKRSSLFTKLTKIITIAAREGADPDMNFKLRMAIDKGKSLSLPKENIERAIAKGSGTGEGQALEEITYEGYGPEGTAIIVEVVTDNKNRSASEVRHILTKHGGSLGGSVIWQFDRKGVIYLKNENITDEQELEIIDDGAEDIEKQENSIRVITAMEDLQKVQEKLQNSFEIDNAELEYLPKNKVKPGKPEKVEKFFEALEECDDINNFYSNAEF